MGQTQKRRVGLFRNLFLPYSETFIHDQLRHHDRFEATVIARRWMNSDQFQGHKVVSIDNDAGRRRRLESLWFGVSTHSPYLRRALFDVKMDIVHAHHGNDGVYAMGIAARRGLPLIVTFHGRDVAVLVGNDKYKPPWWHYLVRYRRLFQRASLFLADSSELRDLVVAMGCPADKVVVHRLGVDLKTFMPVPTMRQTKPPIVVMVGRFVEKKGHRFGIEASAKAIQAGGRHQLVIVGSGPLESEYRMLIEDLGLSDDVQLTGALSHQEVVGLLNRASVLVAPSVIAKNQDRDSGLIVVKEAGACGIPVIGTRHGGIPEIIDDGKTGFLVDEKDCEALSDRLVRLLKNDDLRQNLGMAAREKMEREYDIRQRVGVLEEIYDSVIDAHATASR